MRHSLLLKAIGSVVLCAATAYGDTPACTATPCVAAGQPLREPAPMARPTSLAHASGAAADTIELVLPELPYDATQVSNAANYSITSTNDPAYASAVAPAGVDHRHWPEEAPYRPEMVTSGGNVAHINVVYRVYLRLAAPLQEGKTYSVSVAPAALANGPGLLAFTFANAPTDSIHVNQVAYLSEGPKVAYVSWWTGQGSIGLAANTTFDLVDEANGASVFSGPVSFSADGRTESWSRSTIYSADFSSFAQPGTYHLHVGGVGRSYPFKISPDGYRSLVGYTVTRGLFMQRDGAHGLDRAGFTHFARPAAHLDDAIEESTGLHLDLVGGHMDAGDRGHYPHNSAEMACNLLTAAYLFPEQIEALGESLQLPESGNGIPDYLDEVVYELDWLAKAVSVTSHDGALGFALRPANFGYELGVGPAGAAGRVYFDQTHGPIRSETLYAAGALGLAYNTPLLQKYLPADKLDAYKRAALRAWSAFEIHDSNALYWKDDSGWYDSFEPNRQAHIYSDEGVVAAANLLQITGDPKFAAFIGRELPTDLDAARHYGWQTTGPWLHAFVSLLGVPDSLLDPLTKQRARAAAVSWAEAEVSNQGIPYAAPFGAPLPSPVQNRVGWYFTSAFASMVAYGLTGDQTYRARIARTWNYLLGTNAQSRSFYTGLGDPARRPRWLVHEISLAQYARYSQGDPGGWAEIAPGLPEADIQMGEYGSYLDDAWNTPRKTQKFPASGNDYPALYRAVDGWNANDEFTIERQARQVASLVPLFSTDPPPAAAPVAPPAPPVCQAPSSSSLAEGAMTLLSTTAAIARVLEPRTVELVLTELPFDSSYVTDASRYTIVSPDDADFAQPTPASSVQQRYFPESAPYATTLGAPCPALINVVYRAALRLPYSLKEGKSYQLAIDPVVVSAGPFALNTAGTRANDAIHVNQVAYVPDAPKTAYLSWWTGQGSVDFGRAATFRVVDDVTGESAYEGAVHLDRTGANETWSRSNVYSLDFSPLAQSGLYHIEVPGLGRSLAFRVDPAAYAKVGYTVFRGLTMRRDGYHGLDAPGYTRWQRAASHTQNAVDEKTSAPLDLAGGHIEGSYDHPRDHLAWSSAHAASSMLAAIGLFPTQVEAYGEPMQLPESGNGIPDLLDELAFELDWLAKAVQNSPNGGALAKELSPTNHTRELYVGPAGLAQRTWFDSSSGLSRSATVYAAGALAQAANTPVVCKYAPAKCVTYLAAAQRAWAAFEAHATDEAYWKDDDTDRYRTGGHSYSDEVLVAAPNLLALTGDPRYATWLARELPADFNRPLMLWSWLTDGPWMNAWVSLGYGAANVVDPSVVQRARAAIVAWAAESLGHDNFPYDAPFGTPMNGHINRSVEHWYTPSSVDFPLALAYAVTGDGRYRDQIARDWSYMLGTNPLNRTFVSGLGDAGHRPRWLVDTLAQYEWALFYASNGSQGWAEIAPGLPSADVQTGSYAWYFNDAWNTPRTTKVYPANDANYPALYKYSDSWNRGQEVVFAQQARGAMSLLPLLTSISR